MVTERSFTFPFKDSRWGNKALIGSLLTLAGYLLPIIPTLFVLGYIVRLMRHTIDTGETTLPEWDRWEDLGLKGLYYLIVYLVYLLPGLILLASAAMTFFAGSFVSGVREADGLGFGVFGVISTIMAISMFVLALIALLAGILIVPIAVARLAATDSLGAAFELDHIWHIIRSDIGDFALVWAVSLGLGCGMGFVLTILYYTVCLCLLVPFLAAPFSFYRRVFGMALFAQVYRRGSLSTPQPASPAPIPPAPPKTAAHPPENTGAERAAAPETPEPTESPAGPQSAGVQALVVAPEEGIPPPEDTNRPPLSPYELSLGELGLPVRIQDTLMDAGFVTIGHVLDAFKAGEERLLSVKGFGPRSLQIVKARLQDIGIID